MAKRIIRNTIKLDAADQSVGRLASKAAFLLQGKHKPDYAPHIDAGDFVHIVNAEKLKFTGNKIEQKQYLHHTFYPGGLKSMPLKTLVSTGQFEKIIKNTITRMLPKNSYRTVRLRRITFGKAK
ncbi:MAG: 50S ribosomal protein L13 [Patescibacteria group bacterium]|nr:50S ribosomal protein L13 [Patescibacteria group bacterium]